MGNWEEICFRCLEIRRFGGLEILLNSPNSLTPNSTTPNDYLPFFGSNSIFIGFFGAA